MENKNKTLEESIITAMDGSDIEQIPFLPYILQDFWELGSSSEQTIRIIKKHKPETAGLDVLDLGSGKGAISINIALELKCKCFGIDAMEDFVVFSNNKAKELSIDNICTFETGDIRTRIKTLGKYDIILLGGIGPVLGDYYSTLSQLTPHLNKDGLIIFDDAYIEDDSKTDYPSVLKESELLNQIKNAGMQLIDKITINEVPGTEEGYDKEFMNLQKRCMELIEKHPDKKDLFLGFIEKQKREYEVLSNEIIPAILVITQLR